MVDQHTHLPSVKGPIWFWVSAVVLSLGMAALVFTYSTSTVQANSPLARPASIPLTVTPPASLLPAVKPQAPPALPSDVLSGVATWYGAVLDGHLTASGERFDMLAMTAAHKTLPFGTIVAWLTSTPKGRLWFVSTTAECSPVTM